MNPVLTKATLLKEAYRGINTTTRDLPDPAKMNFVLAAEKADRLINISETDTLSAFLIVAFSVCTSKRTPACLTDKKGVFTGMCSYQPISFNTYCTATCSPDLCLCEV